MIYVYAYMFSDCLVPSIIIISQNLAGRRPKGDVTLTCYFDIPEGKLLRYAWLSSKKGVKLFEYRVCFSISSRLAKVAKMKYCVDNDIKLVTNGMCHGVQPLEFSSISHIGCKYTREKRHAPLRYDHGI